MDILNGTVRAGDTFTYPSLDIALTITDGSAFQKATYWCNHIRGVYKQKEDEDEWKAEQASTRGREADILRRDNEGGDEGAGEPNGDGEPDRARVSSSEKTLEEILKSRLWYIREQLKVANNTLDRLQLQEFVERDKVEQLTQEEIAVVTALEVTCDTREDDEPLGTDIHRQVSGEGQEGGGDVGDEDSTSPTPQDLSQNSTATG